MNQFQSIVAVNPTANQTEFKVYNLNGNSLGLNYTKTIPIANTFTSYDEYNSGVVGLGSQSYNFYSTEECEKDVALNGIKDNVEYLEGDYNGDGISELIIINSINEHHLRVTNEYETLMAYPIGVGCEVTITNDGYQSFLLDLNPNASITLGSQGFMQIDNTHLKYHNKKIVSDFNGDGKSDILIFEPNQAYKIVTLKQLNVSPWNELEIIGQGILDEFSDKKQFLLGDFNGDGKTDIMLPDTEGGEGSAHAGWHIYYANPNPAGGSFFVKESHNIVEYRPDTGIPGTPGADYDANSSDIDHPIPI